MYLKQNSWLFTQIENNHNVSIYSNLYDSDIEQVDSFKLLGVFIPYKVAN